MSFTAYILKSIKDKGYYFGQTLDLKARILKHNSGRVKSTKGRRPFEIHYFEEFESRSEAYRWEQFFKTFEGRIWLKENKIID
jgi:putative endonuclease